MINFKVEDLGQDGQRIALQDQHGRLHVARVVGAVPEVGDALFGQEAQLGPRVLVQQASNKPLQVCFEALSCSQGQVLDLLHPQPEAPAHPSPPASAADPQRRSAPGWAVQSID